MGRQNGITASRRFERADQSEREEKRPLSRASVLYIHLTLSLFPSLIDSEISLA